MNTRVLVIGGCGFIGRELVRQLLFREYFVRVADRTECPQPSPDRNYEFVKLDVFDESSTLSAFDGIDICIDLVAIGGGIGFSNRYPATILSYNNKIHSAVFETASKSKVKHLVYVSSSAVYESSKDFPVTERDVFDLPPPQSGYSFSKLIGEWYCKAFHEEFGVTFTIVRPFNVYGPGELPGEKPGDAHVIPDLVAKILWQKPPLVLLGNGKQTRCFTHVKDIARGIVSVIESKNAINEDFNLSSEREITIVELARILWKLCDKTGFPDFSFVSRFKHDMQRLVPDVSKAKRDLGWEAKIDLEDGLKDFVEWMKRERGKSE